jgi:hypothetical protein
LPRYISRCLECNHFRLLLLTWACLSRQVAAVETPSKASAAKRRSEFELYTLTTWLLKVGPYMPMYAHQGCVHSQILTQQLRDVAPQHAVVHIHPRGHGSM